jgi:hypothetical protein
MKHIFRIASVLSAITLLGAAYAEAQTPGQVPIFDQPGTGACNAAGGNDCVDSVITQDSGGNIGIGTTSPVAKLHVAAGSINLEDSTPSSGNILKAGNPFIHNFGPVNTFMGSGAGNFSVIGDTNVGIGFNALASLTAGFSNTAVGGLALLSNTIGNTNTALGRGALQFNTEGNLNTATGRSALFTNVIGSANTADGVNALQSNFSGIRNNAMGESALFNNSTGNANVAIGNEALRNVPDGANNIAIGDSSGTNLQAGSSNIYIGYPGAAAFSESNTVRIGNCYNGIFGCTHRSFFVAGVATTSVSGVPVLVSPNGQLGVAPSSRRFKSEISDMGEATRNLRKLRPVTFYYKPEVQRGERQLQYGLIAEEVAAVYPELVEYSDTGEPFSVRYQLLGTMLLNELQRQDHQLEEQQKQFQAQEAKIAQLQVQLAAMAHRFEEAGASVIADKR